MVDLCRNQAILMLAKFCFIYLLIDCQCDANCVLNLFNMLGNSTVSESIAVSLIITQLLDFCHLYVRC